MNLSQILASIVSLVAEHPQAVTAVLAYVLLGLLNGVLKVKVDGPAVTRLVSTLVDRLAPTTRANATGTFKWPLFAASTLRGVADVLDPKDPPGGAGTSSGVYREPAPPPANDVPTRSPRSGFLVPALAALMLSLSLARCTPSPRPGGLYQPSGTLATIDGVARILGIVAPVLKPLVLAQIPASDVGGRRAADISLTAFEGTASAWLASRRTWDARGAAGYCDAYIATGAVTSGLSDVIRTLGRSGVGLNVELTDLVNAAGLLGDRLAYCDPVFDAAVPEDADVDAQVRLRARSVAAELRAAVEHAQDDARNRGRSLTPLPNIR